MPFPTRLNNYHPDPRALTRDAGQPDSTKDNPSPIRSNLPAARTASPEEKTLASAVPEINKIVNRVRREVEGAIVSVCGREAARTREWFEMAGLPKAARVARREAYNVLRSHGLIEKRAGRGALVGIGMCRLWCAFLNQLNEARRIRRNERLVLIPGALMTSHPPISLNLSASARSSAAWRWAGGNKPIRNIVQRGGDDRRSPICRRIHPHRRE